MVYRFIVLFFRHPIPDYYSITLEVNRDRITAAHPNVCNAKDPTLPKCPIDYSDGETYLHRTLNEACQKMVSTCVRCFVFYIYVVLLESGSTKYLLVQEVVSPQVK